MRLQGSTFALWSCSPLSLACEKHISSRRAWRAGVKQAVGRPNFAFPALTSASGSEPPAAQTYRGLYGPNA